jgi:type IV secretion system protein TrbL
MEFEFTPGVLDQILNVIQGAIDTALPVLEGDVRFVFQSFLIISIVFSGVAYAFGSLSAGLEFMVKKILLVSGALFLVTNWLDFTRVIVNSFAVLGLRAGGAGDGVAALTTGQFFSPSSLLSIGWGLGDVLFQRASEAGGFTGISVAAFFLFFSALVVALSFLIIALQVFITLLEFKLVTLGGFILIPFALLDRTESLAQAALGYVIAAGIKIFTLAVVVSFAFAIFPNIPIPDELSFATQFVIMGTALTFVLLALKAPSLASSMISGGPSLGVGALAQTAAAVGAAGAVGYAGIKASGAVGSAAGSVIAQARQGLQNRSGGGGGGPTMGSSSRFGGGGGGSGGGAGTAVAVRASTAVRSPGTAVGTAFGGGSSSGFSPSGGGGDGRPSPGSGGGPSFGGWSSPGSGGAAASPGDDFRTSGESGTATDLKAAQQGLKRATIGTAVALHGGNGGGGSARVDISSRK